MSFTFNYRKEKIEEKTRYFPKAVITLFNKGIKFDYPALLDSGATDIFIPKQIAEALELDFKEENIASSWNGDFKVWNSHIGVILGKGSQTFRKVLPCLIPDSENPNQEVILGRVLFNFFEVTFNEQKRTTKLKKIQ
ncbi:MAG: retroviral-like aspartic protease family protein [archaeon]|nr:retroviral-like aspartic protease family protein [archaeon]